MTPPELILLKRRLDETHSAIEQLRDDYSLAAAIDPHASCLTDYKTLLEFRAELKRVQEKEMKLFQLYSNNQPVKEQRKLDAEIAHWYEERLPEWSKIPDLVPPGIARTFHLPKGQRRSQPHKSKTSAFAKQVEEFMQKMTDAGCPITKKDIWTVAGYDDPTEFQRLQREDERATPGAGVKFKRVFEKSPEEFAEVLKNRRSK